MTHSKKVNLFWTLVSVFLLVFVFAKFVFAKVYMIADYRFVFSRAKNMFDCLKDGILPWFFYNDVGGVGYGVTFGYGQLTLYPFLPLVPLGFDVFIKVYVIVYYLLLYFGACSLFKRYSDNYAFLGMMLTLSTFGWMKLVCLPFPAAHLADALGLFFCAKCIDFFRDRRSFIPATLLFVLCLGTNTLSSVTVFLCAVAIFFYYFDKNRIKEYFCFAVLTGILCVQFAVNFLYHSDALTSSVNNPDAASFFYCSVFFFGGAVFYSLYPHEGYSLYDIPTAVMMVSRSRRKMASKKAVVLLVVCVAATVLGLRAIWLSPALKFLKIYQFPCRYMMFVSAFLIIFFMRWAIRGWQKVIVLLGCATIVFSSVNIVSINPIEMEKLGYPTELLSDVVCGEFFGKGYNSDYARFEKLADKTGFTFEKDVTTGIADGQDSMHFPKLWYRGYKAFGDNGEQFEVVSGESNFCDVLVNGYNGVVHLQYVHPWFLKLSTALTYIAWLLLFGYYVIRRHRDYVV